MSLYFLQDVEATDDGDLVVSENGDLKLASPLRTVAQAIDWTILTNKGELLSDVTFGSNIQTFYGSHNSIDNHRLMESQIKQQLRLQGLIDMNDLEVEIMPIEQDEAAILVTVKGSYLDTESLTGAYTRYLPDFDGLVRGYLYPFLGGQIQALAS